MPKHKISKKLQEEYAAGKTQVELAQMYNVSQATINKLLTDPTASENLKATVANIKKLVNDSTIPDEKKVKLIKILLD